jgi:hypothetical protein
MWRSRAAQLVLAAVVLPAAAACGGSKAGADPSAELAATCESQAVLLQEIGQPATLAQATRALRRVVRLETRLIDALSPLASAATNDRPAGLVAELRGARAKAARALATFEQTDPTVSMTPLRTSVPSSRRAIADARRLHRMACEG